MSGQRFKLTTTAKVLLVALVLAVVGGGFFAGLKSGFIKTEAKGSGNNGGTSVAVNKVPVKKGAVGTTDTINISLDEWIGWKEIIDANGGLTTKPGSIYDKLGIKVNISVINDATQSSNALISGSLDAAGYTINRTAFLSQKFKEANFGVIMPYITNFSNGGDGIIAKSNITSVKDFVGAKIGVPQFSEAHTLIVWFVNRSDLTQSQKDTIIKNLIFFETPDEAAKAFFAGKVDVAATWEPYLTQAKNMSGGHVFFSTAVSSSLVMDGIVFSKKFAEANPELVSKFIDGALEATSMYTTDLNAIKEVMPMFAASDDADILDNCEGAKLMTYADNLAQFKGAARTIYIDMCGIWKSIGEHVDESLVNTLYDDRYITALSSKYGASKVTKSGYTAVTQSNRQKVIDTKAMLQKSATIQFEANTAVFLDGEEADRQMKDFLEIASVLDGTIIQIEGNVNEEKTTAGGKKLSEQRAESVRKYFIMNGVDANRIISLGNGGDNPVAPFDTEEHKALNRRTDVFFKCVE